MTLSVLIEGTHRHAVADDAGCDSSEVAHGHASAPVAGTGGTANKRIDEEGGVQAVGDAGTEPQRDEDEAADVEQQRPDRAVRDGSPSGEMEQLGGLEPADAERAIVDPSRMQPARACHRR